MKRIISFILILTLLILPLGAVDTGRLLDTLTSALAEASPSLQPASIGGDWTVIALARSGRLEQTSADVYYANAVEYVKALGGVLSSSRYTEYCRTTLALVAIGRDPQKVGGYDLLAPLEDYDAVIKQGVTGAAWALITLDAASAEPSDSALRGRFVDYILSKQASDGSISTIVGSEVDCTAMALLALANYTDRSDVSKAIDSALGYISSAQNDGGGFSTRWGESSETTSQVIIALCSLGISPDDKRFVKKSSLVDNLLSYRVGDGFAHSKQGGLEYNRMATEQALLALCALDRLENDDNRLFDYSDVKPDNRLISQSVGLPGKDPAVSVPPISASVTFPDVTGTNARECTIAVEALASRGIISGYEDGSFRPDASLTRAEFAALTVRALGLPDDKKAYFTDVSSGAWYHGYVSIAAGYGIINGIGGNLFNPAGTITREEAAAICARAAKLCGLDTVRTDVQIRNTLAPFADYTKSSKWARESLAFCCDAGILDADALTLRPSDAVTRGETAMMLYALLAAGKLI